MIVSFAIVLFGTTTTLPAFVTIFVARQVISRTDPSIAADRHPVADAERPLDLNRQAGEQVAQRVLQREPEHDGAHRRRRQDAIAQNERRDHAEEQNEKRVLHDRQESGREGDRRATG